MLKRKLLITALLPAIILTILMLSWKGDAWEQHVRAAMYKIKGDSIAVYVQEFTDSAGIPYVHYARENGVYAGYQYNATIVANYAIAYYDTLVENPDPALEHRFKNCVYWLKENISYVRGFALYQYNWQQPWYPNVRVPYTSGMTSGRAIEALCYGFMQWKDSSLLNAAMQLMRGYYLPIQQGGFTYRQENGWWYEELADTGLKTPRILDGHIYAISGLFPLLSLSNNNDSVRHLISQGLSLLRHSLPQYSHGRYWSIYDGYGNKADNKYHKILTGQMKELWKLTGDSMFKAYYDNWNKSLTKNYVLKAIEERNRSAFALAVIVFLVNLTLLTILVNALYNWKGR